jgi:hypothetical protein
MLVGDADAEAPPELAGGAPALPWEHAAVRARDPMATTARADRVRADISLLVLEMCRVRGRVNV